MHTHAYTCTCHQKQSHMVTLPQKEASKLTTSLKSKATCTEVLTCHWSQGKRDDQMEKQLYSASQERCSNIPIYKAHDTLTYKDTKVVKPEQLHTHSHTQADRVFLQDTLHKRTQRCIATTHPLAHTVMCRIMERYSSTPTVTCTIHPHLRDVARQDTQRTSVKNQFIHTCSSDQWRQGTIISQAHKHTHTEFFLKPSGKLASTQKFPAS